MAKLELSKHTLLQVGPGSMSSKFLLRSLVRWLLVGLFFLGACFAANLTLYNWWAVGGPPSPQPKIHEARGNLFFAITALLFTISIIMAARNLQHKRARKNQSMSMANIQKFSATTEEQMQDSEITED